MEVDRCVCATCSDALALHHLNVCADFTHTDFQLLLFRSQLVQLLDQLNVLFEDALVLLGVLLCFFLELLLESLNTVLDLSALLAIDLVDVGRAGVMHALIKYPGPVEPNHSFLKLLVAQVVLEQHLLDVIFESLHSIILAGDFVLHLVCSFAKALLSHAKIVYDQD